MKHIVYSEAYIYSASPTTAMKHEAHSEHANDHHTTTSLLN